MQRHFIEFTTPDTAVMMTDTLTTPAKNEVLINVHHSGVNRADLLQRLGLYPPPTDASPIP